MLTISFHFLENINYIYKSQKHKPTSGKEITPFNVLQKNLITSNSWNLFTTVIWNINYDNVLNSFVTWFSKAWQFSFFGLDVTYVLWLENLFTFLSCFSCLLTIFPTFSINFIFLSLTVNSRGGFWCLYWLLMPLATECNVLHFWHTKQ